MANIKKTQNSPRKDPKQERSRFLVENVLEAAARVLDRQGYDGSTTNRIAEKAGISIGSLYQYFPNKEALIGALIERQIQIDLKAFEEELETSQGLSLEDQMTRVVDRLMVVFVRKRGFLGKLFRKIGELDRISVIIQARSHAQQLVKKLLDRHALTAGSGSIELKAFVLVNAVMGVLDAAILVPAFAPSEDALRRELIDLLQGYLRPA